MTGDTLTSSEESYIEAKNKRIQYDSHETASKSQLLVGVTVPEPVFMCSIGNVRFLIAIFALILY